MNRDVHRDTEAFAGLQHLEPVILRLTGQVEGIDRVRHRLEAYKIGIRGGEDDISVQRFARLDIRRHPPPRPCDPRLSVPAVEPVVDPTCRQTAGSAEIHVRMDDDSLAGLRKMISQLQPDIAGRRDKRRIRIAHDPATTGREPRRDRHGGEVYVYRRADRPCHVCGTPVAMRVLAGRNLFWCPTCQPPNSRGLG